MVRSLISMFLFVFVALATSMSMFGQQLTQCAIARVDNHLFASGATVPVSLVSTFQSNCQGAEYYSDTSTGGGGFFDAFTLQLERWKGNGDEWEVVNTQPIRRPSGSEKSLSVANFTGLFGNYRLILRSGAAEFPAVYFAVGGTSGGRFPKSLPSFTPERIVDAGLLFFSGTIPSFRPANTFFYQDGDDGRTTIVLTASDLVEKRKHPINTPTERLSVMSGTEFYSAKIPARTFDLNKIVYAQVEVDGAAVQGIVFDPTRPGAYVNYVSQ